MLEKLPAAVGHLLQNVRPGPEKLVINTDAFAAAPRRITVSSPAFADGAALPARFTEDGAKLSPPLAWSGVPAGAAALVMLVEDADSPTPAPLVHAIVFDLAAADGALAEGALPGPQHEGERSDLGRNSFFSAGWLPPDPPTGHGAHRYTFQFFALDRRIEASRTPGRSALVEAMDGHVLAVGCLTGLYERPAA